MKIAAVADIHVSESSAESFRGLLQEMCAAADLLLLCGDLTNRGIPEEEEALAQELVAHCKLPVLGVLGNHDYESGRQEEVKHILQQGGVVLLEDEPAEVDGVGFAGVKGFCGGFENHALAPWGEQMIKQFVHETVEETLKLESGLAKLRTDTKIVVLHYAPVRDTVQGEPTEIFPFLGSSRLAEPIDRYRASVAFHGHAHNGRHEGRTMSGVPVYNVALPIMRRLDEAKPYYLLEV